MKFRLAVLLIFIIQLANCKNIPNNKTNKVISDSESLNTAANVSYLSSFEKKLVYEINLLRSNPEKYAINYIEPLAKNYRNKMLYYPGDHPLKTQEGVRALNECVRVLKRAKPLPLVYPSYGLSKAANDHVSDQSGSGRIGHTGSDRSNVKKRIERYGKWNIRIAENIAYGGKTPRQVVIYLLIDDGVRDRGHRKTFLHPDYRKIGVAEGSHPYYQSMFVMDFAGAFMEN